MHGNMPRYRGGIIIAVFASWCAAAAADTPRAHGGHDRDDSGGAPYFVAVTNTDLWDASICTGDADRIANTLKLMRALGAGSVDLAALWTVLSTPPEFADTTLHTDAMVPALGLYETRLRV